MNSLTKPNRLTIVLPVLHFFVVTLCSAADTLFVSYGDRTGLTRPDLIGTFDSANLASLGTFATGGLSLPQGLAFDLGGNLYVANYGNNTIQRFTPGGVGSLFANTGVGPTALAFDKTGNLYVANYWGNSIEKITPSGVSIVFATTGLSYPTGLTIDGAGNLYVANGGSLNIMKFSPAGVGSLFVNTGAFSSPLMGLACDVSGNLYLGCMVSNTSGIRKYTPGGIALTFAEIGAGPTGMVFDSEGNLYAANYGNNTIMKFDPSGGLLKVVNTPYSPWGIALQQVPEPSVVALITMMGAGFVRFRRNRDV